VNTLAVVVDAGTGRPSARSIVPYVTVKVCVPGSNHVREHRSCAARHRLLGGLRLVRSVLTAKRRDADPIDRCPGKNHPKSARPFLRWSDLGDRVAPGPTSRSAGEVAAKLPVAGCWTTRNSRRNRRPPPPSCVFQRLGAPTLSPNSAPTASSAWVCFAQDCGNALRECNPRAGDFITGCTATAGRRVHRRECRTRRPGHEPGIRIRHGQITASSSICPACRMPTATRRLQGQILFGLATQNRQRPGPATGTHGCSARTPAVISPRRSVGGTKAAARP